MALHVLKTWPDAFAAVLSGDKTADFRRNDRNFQVGDDLLLKEWDPQRRSFTGHYVNCGPITHVADDPRFGIPQGYCMLSFKMNFHYFLPNPPDDDLDMVTPRDT
jgi:hypothetical protein